MKKIIENERLRMALMVSVGEGMVAVGGGGGDGAALVVQDRNADDALTGRRRRHVGRHVGRFQLGR